MPSYAARRPWWVLALAAALPLALSLAWAENDAAGAPPTGAAGDGQAAGASSGASITPAADYIPAEADVAMLGALATAREGLALGEEAETEQERVIAFSTAIDGLTALYQLYGVDWAGSVLAQLYGQPDSPWLLTGYSADGRIYARVQALELHNPAFADYTIVLCTLGSHSALDITTTAPGALEFETVDGARLAPEPLSETHLLWPKLMRGAGTFTAPREVPSGFSLAFKQIFAVPALSIHEVTAVILQWDPYRMVLRRPAQEHAVGPGGDAAPGSEVGSP